MHMYVYTHNLYVCVFVCCVNVSESNNNLTSSGLYLWAGIVTLVLYTVGYKAY